MAEPADLAAVIARVRERIRHGNLSTSRDGMDVMDICAVAEQCAKLREESLHTISAANNRCLELDQERRSALRERDEARESVEALERGFNDLNDGCVALEREHAALKAECERLRGELKNSRERERTVSGRLRAICESRGDAVELRRLARDVVEPWKCPVCGGERPAYGPESHLPGCEWQLRAGREG